MPKSNRLRTLKERATRSSKQSPSSIRDDETGPSKHWKGWLALAGLLALFGAMALGYVCTLRTIQVDIDGHTLHLRTHVATLGEALAEARVELRPEDRVEPGPDTPIRSGLRATVQRARTVYIEVDGEMQTHRSLATSVGEVLTEAGVKWIPEDKITIAGQEVAGEQPLLASVAPLRQVSSRGGRPTPETIGPAPVQVQVQRAVPISVQDEQTPYTFLTTARTLGEALLDKGITLYEADQIDPPLDTPIRAGMSVLIDRSRPVTLLADGQVLQTRTRAETVADLLKEQEISLGELDYTEPVVDERLTANQQVAVVRVGEAEIIEEESIPFDEEYRANPNLEIDQRQVDNWGAPGVFKRSLKVRYENGVEVSRTLDREWVETPPQNRIISYGTKIVPRQLTTPEGTFTYWRKIRMLATAYSAATCGKARSDPTYGITRVGWKARRGVIAVDPSVIPMYTEMYVPGYGKGTAADTGSLIKGLHIDLCYDEDSLVHWWKWVDVYLLGSGPSGNVPWILPDYPQER